MRDSKIRLDAEYLLLGKRKTDFLLWLMSVGAFLLPAASLLALLWLVKIEGFTSSGVFPIALTAVLTLLVTALSVFFRSEREKAALEAAKGKKSDSIKAFAAFSLRGVWRAFFESILRFTAKSWLLLLFSLPGIIMLGVLYWLACKGADLAVMKVLLTGNATVFLLSFIFYFIISQRYFLSVFLLAQGESAAAAVKKSTRISGGCLVRIAFFKLGFLPRFAACLLLIPMPLYWRQYRQSLAVLANDIIMSAAEASPAYQ